MTTGPGGIYLCGMYLAEKPGLTDRVQAVIYADERGLATPGLPS